MGSLSIWHWFVVCIFFAIIPASAIIPTVRILTKAGHSGWWVIPFLIPGVGLIALWIFAFSRWPALDGRMSKELLNVLRSAGIQPPENRL